MRATPALVVRAVDTRDVAPGAVFHEASQRAASVGDGVRAVEVIDMLIRHVTRRRARHGTEALDHDAERIDRVVGKRYARDAGARRARRRHA